MTKSIGLFAAIALASLSIAQSDLKREPVPWDGYAIVASRETANTDGWKQIVATLRILHRHRDPLTLLYDNSIDEVTDALGEAMPRYLAIVAQPEECSHAFTQSIHRLTRALDSDPWPDVQWGIVTARTWEDAMRNLITPSPFLIRRAAAGTSLQLEPFDEAIWWDEGNAGRSVRKRADGTIETTTTDASDTMPGIVSALNDFAPEFFLSSGRATQDDWRVGFAFHGGAFKVVNGKLIGVDSEGAEHPVDADEPKVWLAAGNCLLGNIKDENSMALAIIGPAGARQFVGYDGVTFHGRAGWGMHDWFLDEPGRWSFAESFFLNQAELLFELNELSPDLTALPLGDIGPREEERVEALLRERLPNDLSEEEFALRLGHLWDRDAMVLYGDPAWDARVATSDATAWESELTQQSPGVWRVRFTAHRDVEFDTPPAMLFPFRMQIANVQSASGEVFLSDSFMIALGCRALAANEPFDVVFDGEPVAWRNVAVHQVRSDEQAQAQLARVDLELRPHVAAVFAMAKNNRGELVAALEDCDDSESLAAMSYLLAWMPQRDATQLQASFLLAHVTEALDMRKRSPWTRDLPESVFLNEVLPYAFVGERREQWRQPLRELFFERTSNAPTQEAAVRLLNDRVWKELGVVYHASKRPKTDQSPSETIDCGVASCTGLSILLADACRAVGIPARLAGVPMWHNDSGNHTWIEVWDNGAWHFVEALGSDGYDRAWWSEQAKKTDGKRDLYALWATTWKPSGKHFPLEWDPSDQTIPAVNVTERYHELLGED